MKEHLFQELFIFELANNHQGDVSHGLKIIDRLGELAREFKINAAVKLQYRDLDTIIHPAFANRKDVKHIPRFLDTRLTPDEFYTMIVAIREAGMHTMCTPFDERSVDLCMDHGVEILKVASCSALDWPLLEVIAATGRPVIISTGGKSFSDIDKIYNFFCHRNVRFALMHCVGLYPAEEEYLQLSCIERMKNRYPNVTIGYSGHENPSDFYISQMSVAMGAEILERHVGLSTDEIRLNTYSSDLDTVADWLPAIISARRICGEKNIKKISRSEVASMNELARGCYASRPISTGQKISKDDIFFAMPCAEGQTTSGQFRGDMISTRDYKLNDAIMERREYSLISDTRSIIHDIKGMLFEAHVIVGNDFELELSHHYGLEHFRNWGVTLINIVNREYCKKILIVLPGQKHPMHMHKVKEETFQVLFGELILNIQEEKIVLHTGSIYTVERGVIHAFSSEDGCIFEEISTTHVKDDSYYIDDSISKSDIMERKTLLTDW